MFWSSWRKLTQFSLQPSVSVRPAELDVFHLLDHVTPIWSHIYPVRPSIMWCQHDQLHVSIKVFGFYIRQPESKQDPFHGEESDIYLQYERLIHLGILVTHLGFSLIQWKCTNSLCYPITAACGKSLTGFLTLPGETNIFCFLSRGWILSYLLVILRHTWAPVGGKIRIYHPALNINGTLQSNYLKYISVVFISDN